MTRQWCSLCSAGIRLTVQVTPNARKSEVVGIHDDAIKIKIHAQPIEGKANEELIRFVADRLALPQRAIIITHGHIGKYKTLEASTDSLTVDDVKRAFFPDRNYSQIPA